MGRKPRASALRLISRNALASVRFSPTYDRRRRSWTRKCLVLAALLRSLATPATRTGHLLVERFLA